MALAVPTEVTALHHLVTAFSLKKALTVWRGFYALLAAARRTPKGLAALKRLQERIEAHHAAQERQDYFRVNTELHQAIVAQAGNPVLRETHERLMARVRRVRYQALLSQALGIEIVSHVVELGTVATKPGLLPRPIVRRLRASTKTRRKPPTS